MLQGAYRPGVMPSGNSIGGFDKLLFGDVQDFAIDISFAEVIYDIVNSFKLTALSYGFLCLSRYNAF